MFYIDIFKEKIRKIPYVGTFALLLKRRMTAKSSKRASLRFVRIAPYDVRSEDERQKRKLLNVIRYTQGREVAYSATSYPAAYHTIEIGTERIPGQRDPAVRLAAVPYDFSGKSVLDIGCNQGGMLFALRDSIQYGIGVDFDGKMINAAHLIKAVTQSHNTQFYIFDVDCEPLEILEDLLPDQQVDIIFLLSVCMWITNWRELITWCAKHCNHMLFESNGTAEMQAEQLAFLRGAFSDVILLSDQSDDDPKCKNRKLYFCSVRFANG